GDGDDRAAGAEVAVLEHAPPRRGEGAQDLDRIAVLGGPVDRADDVLPRVAHGVLDQLRLAAREVVVDRAARRAAVLDHIAEARTGEALLTDQHRGARDHPVAAARPLARPPRRHYDLHHTPIPHSL